MENIEMELPNIPKHPDAAKVDAFVAESEKTKREEIISQAGVLQSLVEIDNFLNTPVPKDYKRIRLGKMIFPISFIEHVYETAKMLNISPTAIWQAFMLDSMERYTDGMVKAIEEHETEAKDLKQRLIDAAMTEATSSPRKSGEKKEIFIGVDPAHDPPTVTVIETDKISGTIKVDSIKTVAEECASLGIIKDSEIEEVIKNKENIEKKIKTKKAEYNTAKLRNPALDKLEF